MTVFPGYTLARGTSTWLYVVALVFALLVVGAFWFDATARVVLTGLAVVAGVLLALLVNFFRDPERQPAPGVASPADGVVTDVITLPDGGTRINTFMNPLDVHVNRAPVTGRVVSVKHHPGGYVPAFKKESERNERMEWVLDTEIGEVRFVQIAGTLARRIIPYKEPGDKVEKGERVGIIRLGSRVDLYLPPGPRVTVKPGDKLKAGESQVATIA